METSPEYFHSELPVGRSGEWSIEKIVIPERAYNPDEDSRPDCFKFRPGTYTGLSRGHQQFMTDFYDEWWTQRPGIEQALRRGGEILITGLGLGLIAEAMLRPTNSPVGRITIIEFSSDVIRLVAPYIRSRYPDKVEIIEADAFTWQPPPNKRFTVGWHDIWPNPTASTNFEEMERLEIHYRDYCDWQGFWPKTYLAEVNNNV